MRRVLGDAALAVSVLVERRTPVALALVVLGLLVVGTAGATPDVGEKHNGFSILDERALERYEAAHAKDCDVGRNIVDDGYRHQDGSVTPPTDAQVREFSQRLELCIHPPPPPAPAPEPEPAAASTEYTSTPAPAAPTSTGGGCPSYMAAEASSPSAVNASSGASGCYQVLPSTAAAMGPACADVNADSCVAAICASQGNGAWAASGATPCNYIGKP
jgi:hypothetical protein